MGRMASQRISRFSLDKTFESFWSEHAAAVDLPLETALASPAASKDLLSL
jgi:hypothetical protein